MNPPMIYAKICQKTPEPPKSGPGACKIEPGAVQYAIFKDIYLKKALGAFPRSIPYHENMLFEVTWLHVGGPRGPKIEAESSKNRC